MTDPADIVIPIRRAIFVGLLAAHDVTLGKLREQWMAAGPERKAGWFSAIDAALDQRLRLMEMRDKTEE